MNEERILAVLEFILSKECEAKITRKEEKHGSV